jgi:hypothetical protein
MAQSYLRIEGINELLSTMTRSSEGLIDKEFMGEIGSYLVFKILDRTSKGKDVEGDNFEPYSPKYRLFRMKNNRPVNIVNLFFHGSMLASLTYSEYDQKVEVYFMNTFGKTPSGKPSKVSNAQKAYFLNQDREFFGISKEEERAIRQMIIRHVANVLTGEK